MPVVLAALNDGKKHRQRELREVVATELGVSAEERAELLPSGSQSIYTIWIESAERYLRVTGLLTLHGGSAKITDRGQDVLSARGQLMAEPVFRHQQNRDRYAPHVRPINELVDELRGEGCCFVPYLAPMQGGTEARLLTLLRDPGPKTQDGTGSGFLCVENDDPSAEREAFTFAVVGISPSEFTPWNAFPWYINKNPTSAQLKLGVEPLVRLVSMMPRLRVVMLQGGAAQAAWKHLIKLHPRFANHPELLVIETLHPSLQALRHKDPAVRHQREQRRWDDALKAADRLRECQ